MRMMRKQVLQENISRRMQNGRTGYISAHGIKNVPNSDSKLSNGCGSSTRNSITEQQRLDSNEKKNWNEIRSKAERCSEQEKM
jgi:hypothetical protein